MFGRTSFLALLFVGLVSLLPREATAQFPPIDAGWVDFSSGGGWNSQIQCDLPLGGTGTSSIDTGSLSESGPVNCTLTDGTTVLGPSPCQFQISYDQLTSQCNQNDDGTSTLNVTGACGIASVSGTLNCNPQNLTTPPPICGGNQACTATLGVSTNQCDKIFPAIGGFAAGEIANATASTPNNSCEGAIAHLGSMRIRFCGGSFVQGFDCGNPGNPTVVTADTSLFLTVEGAVTQSVQTTCGQKDKGSVNLTIFPGQFVDPARIDPANVFLEGVQAFGCTVKPAGMVCKVPTCQLLGPTLFGLPKNPDGTVTAEITGLLLPVEGQEDQTPIRGETDVVLSTK